MLLVGSCGFPHSALRAVLNHNMRIELILVSVLLAVSCHAEVFIAPDGNDRADGSEARPVATLHKAVELARKDPARKVVVLPGEYLNTNLTLTPDDSGLTIEGRSLPLLAGGVILHGWKIQGKYLVADVPVEVNGPVRLLQINGAWRSKSRFPAEGRLTHESRFDVPWMSTTGGGWKRKPTDEELTTLVYKQGDVPPDLDVRNAEITVFHMWDESCTGLIAHDPSSRTLRLTPALGHPPGAFGVRSYVLWNLPQGMTRPGQWYHDRSAGRIVYWPMQGETAATLRALIPTTETIVSIAGTKQRPVERVTLANLRLAVAGVPLKSGGFAASAYDGPSASATRATSHCAD